MRSTILIIAILIVSCGVYMIATEPSANGQKTIASLPEPKVLMQHLPDNKVSVDFYNETGSALRFMIIAEGWKKHESIGLSENTQWTWESSDLLANGTFSAGEKGRTEKVGSITQGSPFKGLSNTAEYIELRFRIILEWDEGLPHCWQSPKCKVIYLNI